MIIFATSCSHQPDTHNILTEGEKKAGWRLLFDGKTTSGWHVYNKGDAASAWEASDGELQCNPSDKIRGDLVSDSVFENFELSFDWKIEKGGNSGVLINVQEEKAYPGPQFTGPEFQLLDNENSNHRGDVIREAGSLYGVVSHNASAKPRPHGEWNSSRILQQGGRIVFTLNGNVACDINLNSDEWNAMVAKSSLKSYANYGKKAFGHIALQNHNDEVSFRAIKIRKL